MGSLPLGLFTMGRGERAIGALWDAKEKGTTRPPKSARASHRCVQERIASCPVQLVSSLHLDHDLAFCSSSFDVGQRFIRRLEWKDLVHHRTNVSSVDQGGNLPELIAACLHEKE